MKHYGICGNYDMMQLPHFFAVFLKQRFDSVPKILPDALLQLFLPPLLRLINPADNVGAKFALRIDSRMRILYLACL